MPNVFDQTAKVIEDNLPKALLGAVVPAVQYCWKYFQERRIVHRRKTLRDEIISLMQFRQCRFDDSPQASMVREDADAELASAIVELAEMSPRQSRAVVGLPYDWLKRWLLLYIPRRRIAWIPQTLFFMTLTLTVLMGYQALLDINAPAEAGRELPVFLIAFVLVLIIRVWATLANEDPTATWIPTTLMVGAAMFGCFNLFGQSLGDDDNFSLQTIREHLPNMAWGTAVSTVLAMVAWIWRRRLIARANRA